MKRAVALIALLVACIGLGYWYKNLREQPPVKPEEVTQAEPAVVSAIADAHPISASKGSTEAPSAAESKQETNAPSGAAVTGKTVGGVAISSLDDFQRLCLDHIEQCSILASFFESSENVQAFQKLSVKEQLKSGYQLAHLPVRFPVLAESVRGFFEKIYPETEARRYRFIGAMYAQMNDVSKAKPFYDTLTGGRFPENVIALADVAKFYFDAKEYEKAYIWEKKLISFYEKHADHNSEDQETTRFHYNRMNELKRLLNKSE